METIDKIVKYFFFFSIWCLWFKTIMGFHFPWETCECCGKKYKDHKRINEVD
jgi:hypothetical protein